MANPGVIGAMPQSPAPSVPGAAPGPSSSQGGVMRSARGMTSPDFAADLARLVALLGAGRPNAVSLVGGTDASVEPRSESASPIAETADAVDTLCAEVALVVPGTEPCASSASSAIAAPVEPATSTPEDPAAGVADEGPTRTLRVLLTPPGATMSAEHRSVHAPDAPTRPTLPLLPAAAAGASAFAVVSEAVPDAGASGTAAALSVADAEPVSTSGAASPLNVANAGPAQTTHAVAARIIDTLHPQAARQVAETVAWHVPAQGVAEVQIRLNPAELGPLEVQLKLDGDKVSVRFDLSDERVRDVVQTSLPSLSALLAARGLQLDQAQVFTQARGQGSSQQHPHPQAPGLSAGKADGESERSLSAVTRPMIRRGLLDDYA